MRRNHNTLRILCQAFQLEFDGHDHRCERLLVEEAFKIHRSNKLLVPIIDDAHLMPTECLRRLRLLFEDFPPSHNLVLKQINRVLLQPHWRKDYDSPIS